MCKPIARAKFQSFNSRQRISTLVEYLALQEKARQFQSFNSRQRISTGENIFKNKILNGSFNPLIQGKEFQPNYHSFEYALIYLAVSIL